LDRIENHCGDREKKGTRAYLDNWYQTEKKWGGEESSDRYFVRKGKKIAEIAVKNASMSRVSLKERCDDQPLKSTDDKDAAHIVTGNTEG